MRLLSLSDCQSCICLMSEQETGETDVTDCQSCICLMSEQETGETVVTVRLSELYLSDVRARDW